MPRIALKEKKKILETKFKDICEGDVLYSQVLMQHTEHLREDLFSKEEQVFEFKQEINNKFYYNTCTLIKEEKGITIKIN